MSARKRSSSTATTTRSPITASGGTRPASEDYGEDGASIEIYLGSRNYVHHNRSTWGDSTFSELGGSPSHLARDNVFAFNLYVASGTVDGSMLVVRGDQSSFGANPGTKFFNNTAYWVSIGTTCFSGCSRSILSSHNNIIYQRNAPNRGVSVVFADAPFDEGNNLYFKSGGGTFVNIGSGSMSSSSAIADPQFLNALNGDFYVSTSSPARDAGTLAPVLEFGIQTDLAGKPIPQTGSPDLGAFVQP